VKIDRLLGIITTLLQNEKVTAPYLAEKFEVSRRTINRDVEDICKAGIPIVTQQGVNGGISILEGYTIEKALFSQSELKAILSGLLTLDSVAQNKRYHAIIEKFSGENSSIVKSNTIMIDLSSHYKDTLVPKIDLIKESIECRTVVGFDYYKRGGQKHILLDPYILVFKWSSWYVFGTPHGETDFKLYKLNRLWNLERTTQDFELVEIPTERLNHDNYFTDEITAVILFNENAKYRLIEEYGMDSFTMVLNSKLRFEFSFTNADYLIQWVLSFGKDAQLIEPDHLRDEVRKQLKDAVKHYL